MPATIVNWAGDEAVSVQEWTAYLAELSGLPAQLEVVSTPGTLRGSIADVSRRNAFTGPCKVSWKDGLRQTWESRATNPQQPGRGTVEPVAMRPDIIGGPPWQSWLWPC